jgi:hypothetical protein
MIPVGPKVYDYPPDEQRQIPIMDAERLARLRRLGEGREWVFQSRNGTPINAGDDSDRALGRRSPSCDPNLRMQ